ncbi:MAG: 16S rRNA (guanine(966)-N(2))-methyltransferase RsmD [Caulobacteraceae bacterium]
MRIISGKLRGRAIVAPKGHSTRPTADRVREAIFDVLEHAAFARPMTGLAVADLFAGSGAMGMEALSRGAARCVFCETDPAACEALASNLSALGLASHARLERAGAEHLADPGPFDLVFLDPPYRSGLAEEALERLVPRLAPEALVVVERARGERPLVIAGLIALNRRAWGRTEAVFLGHRA